MSDECQFDDKTRMMLAKAIEDLSDMTKFMEEFIGICHHMILDLYKQTGKEMPSHIKEYKFRNKNPWGEPEN